MKEAEKNLQGMEKCCGLCVLPCKKLDDKMKLSRRFYIHNKILMQFNFWSSVIQGHLNSKKTKVHGRGMKMEESVIASQQGFVMIEMEFLLTEDT